jgi:hypothetical protein
MADQVSHWLNVRDRPGFLHRLMVELAGDAQLSLEGDLSRCRFTDDVVIARDKTGTLKRNTIAPRQDFVVLRLSPETVDPIFKQVMAAGLKQAISHVQIERNGVPELGAYDNFHPECVVTGPGVSSILLVELKNANVLRGFRVAEPKQ